MTIADILDLELAFRRVRDDQRDDAIPDLVGYRDYGRALDENISSLRQKVQSLNDYQCQAYNLIYLPKKRFTLRPGLVPHIDDRILYQSLADLLIPLFTPEHVVYSNRFKGGKSDSMFVQGVTSWLLFQKKMEEYCNQCNFVVQTDLCAYFDHVNHDLLFSRLNDLFLGHFGRDNLDSIKTILNQKLLARWRISVTNTGLPQINNASSFFGNLYLDELDKWLIHHKYRAIRYVDDIRIFTDTEGEARQALANLVTKLLKMGLYVNSGKTEILSSEKVLDNLVKNRDELEQIDGGLNSTIPENIENAAKRLETVFNQLVSDESYFDDRIFRFCINRFKRLSATKLCENIQEKVIPEVLCRFSKMPESTDIFIDYLSSFPNNETIQYQVLHFLQGSDNIYSWQEMLLIELLIRSDISDRLRTEIMQFAHQIVNNGNHVASRAKAVILCGKNGSYADRREMRDLFASESQELIKKSIVIAIQEMQLRERNHFFDNVKNESREIRNIVDYVSSLRSPKYHYFNPPSPYDVDTSLFDSDDLYDLGPEVFS